MMMIGIRDQSLWFFGLYGVFPSSSSPTPRAACGLSVLVGVLFLLLIEVVFIYGYDLVRFFCSDDGNINVFLVNGMMMTMTMFIYPPCLGYSISLCMCKSY